VGRGRLLDRGIEGASYMLNKVQSQLHSTDMVRQRTTDCKNGKITLCGDERRVPDVVELPQGGGRRFRKEGLIVPRVGNKSGQERKTTREGTNLVITKQKTCDLRHHDLGLCLG
jgi:hypothetical protein